MRALDLALTGGLLSCWHRRTCVKVEMVALVRGGLGRDFLVVRDDRQCCNDAPAGRN